MLLTAASFTSLTAVAFLIGAGLPPAAGAAVFDPVFAASGELIGFLAGAAPVGPVFRTSPAEEVVELVLETTDVRLVVELDLVAAAVVVVVDVAVFWVVV